MKLASLISMAAVAMLIFLIDKPLAQSNQNNMKPSETICQDQDGNIVGFGSNCICGTSICVENPCAPPKRIE